MRRIFPSQYHILASKMAFLGDVMKQLFIIFAFFLWAMYASPLQAQRPTLRDSVRVKDIKDTVRTSRDSLFIIIPARMQKFIRNNARASFPGGGGIALDPVCFGCGRGGSRGSLYVLPMEVMHDRYTKQLLGPYLNILDTLWVRKIPPQEFPKDSLRVTGGGR